MSRFALPFACLATLLLAVPTAFAQTPNDPVGPRLEIVQTLKAGEDGLPKPSEVAKSGKHSWASLFVSPEGKWVYGQLWA